MLACGRSLVFCVLICFVGVFSKNKILGINKALLEYKQNTNFGVNKSRVLPPILIIPVLMENYNNENLTTIKFHENNTLTLRLVHNNIVNDDENDIDVGFRQSLNRGMGTYNKPTEEAKTQIKVRSSESVAENKTDIVNITEKLTEQNMKTEMSQNKTGKKEALTLPEGLYPASSNSNKDTNSISLTMTNSDANLPPVSDNRWQNFTVSTNLNFGNESTTKEPDPSTNRGPYSAAFYNNGMIDQISITTNSYTNEESPLPSPTNDQWRAFSQDTQYSANQFKPLAGLYYDGFLHKPLIMLPGFIPRNYYNL